MTEILYLYGFLAVDSPSPPGDLLGIDDQPVELVELDEFRAVVSRLPAEEYRKETVEERLDDLRWVARRGLVHERVVTWFVDQGRIVPAGFLTLYSSREALREEARERAERIQVLLEGVARAREWNLKVSYDAETLDLHLGEESREIRELDREIEAASPGRRYLLEKKRSAVAERTRGRVARRMADALLEQIGTLAEDVRSLPLTSEKEGEGPVVLHAALLVQEEGASEIRGEVADRARLLRQQGLEVSFSGPWAPYRFLDEEGDAEEAGPPRGEDP